MAANLLLVEEDLEFGVPVVADCVLQEIEARRDADRALARGEQGAKIGVSIYGGELSELTGRYLYLGTAFGGGIGEDIASDVGTSMNLTGPVVVEGYGLKRTNEGFAEGDFKAVNLDGATLS